MAGASPRLHPQAAIAADCSLLVPLRLQALSVPEDADPENWADLIPRYNVLHADTPQTLGRDLQRTLFEDRSEPLLGPGIHLHWSLPAAFTHIEQKQGTSATFPPVPNRWLVVRLWDDSPGTLGYFARIITSDYLAGNGTNQWLELDDGSGEFRANRKIGRAFALDGYTEQPSVFDLTALAPGNLSFASYYPACRNVFGWYDRLSGDQQGTYSYFVAGWFADPAKDPLAGATDKTWLERMGQLGWTVPDDITRGLPTRILCHAAINGVSWPPTALDTVGGFPNFELAVGGSAVEAIAALVNQRRSTPPQVRDRLLGLLQFGLLQDRAPTAYEVSSGTVRQRGRLASLRSALHEQTFIAIPGGTRWEIDRSIRNGGQPTQQNQPMLTLPADLALKLKQVNRDQLTYDAKERELIGLQREIFFQWYKQRLLGAMSIETDTRTGRTRRLAQRIEDARPKVAELRTELAQLKTAIDGSATAIRDAFTANEAWRGYALVPRPMPRYWRPNDPTLLLAGIDIPTLQEGKSPLTCRVTGQSVSSFNPRAAGIASFDVEFDDLRQEDAVKELISKLPAGAPPGIIELLCEALLLDRQRLALLARIAYRKRTGFDPDDDARNQSGGQVRSRFESRVPDDFTIADRRATEPGAAAAFGAALSASVAAPSPFKPLLMIWEARYLPAIRENGLQPWRLDRDGVDYVWNGPAPAADLPPGPGANPYSGYAPLSDTVRRGLENKQPRPAQIDSLVPTSSLVVQSLAGFTEALLQHDGTLQLPPLQENSRVIDRDVRKLVGDQYATAPWAAVLDKPSFYPIRGGHISLDRLWVVDTFGRARRVVEPGQNVPTISISHNLAVSGCPQLVRLAPRLSQPARLLFRWLSADNDAQEFLGDTATQPICGWIIHNRLDRSLLICDAHGRELGTVQSVLRPGGWDGRGIRWEKLPLGPIGPAGSAPRPSASDISNPHLYSFVNGLIDLADSDGKSRTAAFENFLTLISAIETAEPRRSDQQGLSVLVGRPLALVRASLRLDLLGPPAADQSWGQLDAEASASGFTQTPFTVRLGNRRKGADGLIGYFPPSTKDDRRLQLSDGLDPTEFPFLAGVGGNHEYFRAQQGLSVTCDPSAPPVLLTLLLDPCLGVHVSSGILPTKVIDLPADLVSDTLSRLEVPFLVAPVLGEHQTDGVPAIPLPGDMQGSWMWTFRPAPNAEATKPVEIRSETAPARSLFKTMALYEGWLALRRKQTE